MEIRAAPFPSEIVDLDTVEEVYDWLNTLFGGDHLPDRATEPEKYNAFIKKLEKGPTSASAALIGAHQLSPAL